MKKSAFTIGRKIFGGFIFLIVIFAINAAISIFTINSSNQIIMKTADVIYPSTKAIDEFVLLVTESKMLITNWVYLQNNMEDKEALKDLQNYRYPELKEKLIGLAEAWHDQGHKQAIDSVFDNFEVLIGIEKEIMSSLISFEDYEDPMVKLLAEESIESEVLPRTNQLKTQLNKVSAIKRIEADEAQLGLVDSSKNLRRTTIILGIITIVLGLIGALLLTHSITQPINYIKETIIRLAKGDLSKDDKKSINFNRDEVGEMAQAVEELVSGLRATSDFAENIGQGNYQAEFKLLSENDVLGNALIEMRNNLEKVAEDDRRRNWSTEGTAKFGEILRQNNHNVKDLCNSILSHLVKYMHANQGGLYIVQDEDSEQEAFLTLEACYAWDKKKYIEQKIYKGEGLAGQAWQEKDTIYITDVPEDYISITSGLGDANPSSILIVPLIVNDEVYGAIEIASFKEFEQFEVEFLEKIAESIASSISSAKISTKTQQLLEESTQMTEQMQAQEEEMRQNMEELQATQEEMGRKQRNMEEREARVKAVLDTSLEAFLSIDTEGRVDFFNKNAVDILGYPKEELEGLKVSKLFKDIKADKVIPYFEKNVEKDVRQKLISKSGKEMLADITVGSFEIVNKKYYVARIIDIKEYAQKAKNTQDI